MPARHQELPDKDFEKIYNSCPSKQAVKDRTGYNDNEIVYRVRKLRKVGVYMRSFVVRAEQINDRGEFERKSGWKTKPF